MEVAANGPETVIQFHYKRKKGQALGYKMGSIQVFETREKAKRMNIQLLIAVARVHTCCKL